VVWQAEHCLFLYPESAKKQIDTQKISEALIKQAFIGTSLGDQRYATGERFTSLLTFMGCSPHIELDPQENQPYCYIEIHTTEKPVFNHGTNLKKITCPHCKQKIQSYIDKQLLCPKCKNELIPDQINWRKSAFIASTWITIGNIYELEAVPSDFLLDLLEETTGESWKSAYIRQNVGI